MVWSNCANRCPHTCMDVRLGTCSEDEEEDCEPGKNKEPLIYIFTDHQTKTKNINEPYESARVL